MSICKHHQIFLAIQTLLGHAKQTNKTKRLEVNFVFLSFKGGLARLAELVHGLSELQELHQKYSCRISLAEYTEVSRTDFNSTKHNYFDHTDVFILKWLH